MYAIKNKRNGKWLFGTDYRYHPPHQRTSTERVFTWDEKRTADNEFKGRKCGKDYIIVPVKIIEVDADEQTDKRYEWYKTQLGMND